MTRQHQHNHPRLMGRQRGVAIITALLLTALAITIVTSLFWQQQVQVRSMENQRLHLQTRWIVRGALDYARLILQQDGRSSSITALDGIWATPLAETRLDDYVERERVEGDNYKATLSGQISDAQSRYNLANLATGKNINPGQVAMFRRLLSGLQIDSGLAQTAAQALANSQTAAPPTTGSTSGSGIGAAGSTANSGTSAGTSGTVASTGSGAQPLGFVQVDDLLSVPGFTPQIIEQLRDYVTVLPGPTYLNVNTAPAQVLAALVDNLSLSEATSITHKRDFRSVTDFNTLLGTSRPLAQDVGITVQSSYFLVVSHVLLDRAELDAEALLQRDAQQVTTVLSIREN
jgi:general secretion pathway protein K